MTSAHAIQLVERITQSDLALAAPLFTLLFSLRTSRNDPVTEAALNDAIGHAYTKTDHCEAAMSDLAAEMEAELSNVLAA